MKANPISEKIDHENRTLIAKPAGKDPQAENPHAGNNPYDEKRPTAPESEPHFFYYPSLLH